MGMMNKGEILNTVVAVTPGSNSVDGTLVECSGMEVERAVFHVKADQAWELYVKYLYDSNLFGLGQMVGYGPATGGNYASMAGLFTGGNGFVVYVKNVGAGNITLISVRCQVGE